MVPPIITRHPVAELARRIISIVWPDLVRRKTDPLDRRSVLIQRTAEVLRASWRGAGAIFGGWHEPQVGRHLFVWLSDTRSGLAPRPPAHQQEWEMRMTPLGRSLFNSRAPAVLRVTTEA